MGAQSDIVLQLTDVTRTFGGVVAVNNVSFEVARGEFVTLLGPSGCGKTSTLRLIAGFLAPNAGEIRLQGDLVNNVPPYERDIGMVFQSYALFPHMTVAQNVGFGLQMRRVAKAAAAERIANALGLVQLGGYERRFPHELSGGQQQRVAIARALVVEPAILLMDEPMSNLDALLRAEMQLELKRIIERVGVTTINVTHNQEEALAMSDRIIVMSTGHIEQVGTPLDVYAKPASTFVASFLGRSNILVCEVERRDDSSVCARLPSGGTVVIAGVDAAVGEHITFQVRPESITLKAGADAGENTFAGVVRQVAFMGSWYEYLIDVSGTNFLVHVPAAASRNTFDDGNAVSVAWSADDMVRLEG